MALISKVLTHGPDIFFFRTRNTLNIIIDNYLNLTLVYFSQTDKYHRHNVQNGDPGFPALYPVYPTVYWIKLD